MSVWEVSVGVLVPLASVALTLAALTHLTRALRGDDEFDDVGLDVLTSRADVDDTHDVATRRASR